MQVYQKKRKGLHVESGLANGNRWNKTSTNIDQKIIHKKKKHKFEID
jgi:hypothetical protein